jgi:hypothetical protein
MLNLPEEVTLSDILGIAGIYLSLKNLELNLTQTDKQELLDVLDEKISLVIEHIEQHLAQQDEILAELRECTNDNSRNISEN